MEESRSRSGLSPQKYCAIALAGVAGLAAAAHIFAAIGLARLPFELNYEEGNILNAALRITHGLSPYPDPHAFPNVLNPYGPVFYYVTSVAIRVGGIRMLLPRLIVVMAAIVAAFAIGLLVRSYSRSWLLACAFGFLFLTTRLVFFWMPRLRVDFLGLALVLVGLWIFGSKRWLWSVPIFVLALFVKYSFLAAPGACLLYLLLRKQWRHAALSVLLGGSLTVALFMIAQSATSGYFAFHMFGTHPDPFFWSDVGRYLRGLVQLDFPLATLAFAYLIFQVAYREITLPMLYLATAAIGTLTIGKLGSDSNHLLELHAVLILCAALGFAEIAERLKIQSISVALTGAATVLLAWFALRDPRVVNDAAAVRDCGTIYSFVQHLPGEVLSSNTGMLVLTGKPLFVSNAFVYRYLVAKGWSDRPIQEKIERQAFAAIVLSSDPTLNPHSSERWSPQVMDKINENYIVAGHFECTEATTLLLPKSTASRDGS